VELDANENDGAEFRPPDDRNGQLQRGLISFITLQGTGKVNPNLAPYEVLLTVPGVSKRIADEIVGKRRGSDGVLGTTDDYIFEKLEDLLELSSVSQFREFEYDKMIQQMKLKSECYTIRVCAASKDTAGGDAGQLHRIQTCLKVESEGIGVLSWLEDNGF
jgi:hypothetical protein